MGLRFLGILLWLSVGGWGQAPANVPAELRPPAGEILARQAQGTGEQIYTCDGTAWTLLRPDAKLFDASGKQVGSHYAGPTWEWSDGSKVMGRAVGTATPNADSIPWLLLTATDHEGDGVLKKVTSIQRLMTKGGKAPSAGCNALHKGEEYRAHYTAAYYFYVRQ